MKGLAPILTACVLLALVSTAGFAQSGRTVPSDFPDYEIGSQAITSTPGTQGGSAGAYWNPAGWAAMRRWEGSLIWNDRNVNNHRMDNWSAYLGGHGVGFAMRRNDFLVSSTRTGRVDDYQLSLGGGDPGSYWAVAWNWARGAQQYRKMLGRDDFITLGNISRPFDFLSVGNAASLGLHRGDYRAISDIGIRPLRNHRLTLFGDAAYGRKNNFSTMQWGAGLEIQPINGVRIAGKISKPYDFSQDKVYSVSLGISVDGTGFHVVPHYDKDSNRLSNDYVLRLGGQEPTFDTDPLLKKAKRVISMPLKGRVTYQRFQYMDPGKFRLKEMLDDIEAAKNDVTVQGIAMNLSGFDGSRELLWEVREKLKEFKASGKKVYIYFDNAAMATYNFASVADYLWMDPQGRIMLPGYVAGRTYYKGALEKLGLGVQEWRFFAYKSAFESFARKNMSEKDKEQRLALISDFYDLWQKDVAESRKISTEALRAVVDSQVVLTSQMAMKFGLIDSIGRWDKTSDFVKKLNNGKSPDMVDMKSVQHDKFADPYWGEPPKVAVVYALGECDMERGIRGRYTSNLLKSLAERKDVKAVVLRADSPGGDPLPSDLVAEQMKAVSKNKPMIVSQGDVAGSGGYWISMNGDRIFASPYSITGSIGVIGGWFWNDSLTKKTGFTTDYVKVGNHADLGFGVTLPIIGATIPDRNLTDEEFARVKTMLLDMYHQFTVKVAEGRKLDTAYVDSVGQGRVWSGTRALDLKLVDEIGGLDQALQYARTKAKLPAKGNRVQIVEYPKPGWFNFSSLGGGSPISMGLYSWLGLYDKTPTDATLPQDYEFKVMSNIAKHPGTPLMMVAPEDVPAEDRK
jgi:protease-4